MTSSPSRAPTWTSPTPTRCAPPCATARPDAIINCAAWTNVDGAETAEAEATRINGDGAGHVAAAAAEVGAHLVHVCTDYVFAGRRDRRPTARTRRPARSAPTAAPSSPASWPSAAAPASHAIVRTAWVFGPHGKNFVDTMLRARRRRATRSRSSTTSSAARPTPATSPPALIAVAEQRLRGVLHVAGGGSCTWWELAVAAYERAGPGRHRPQAARPRSSARPRRAPPTPSSARPAPTRPPCRRGRTGSPPI